jgi:hypothetical protein
MEVSFTELDNLDKQNTSEKIIIPQNLNTYNVTNKIKPINETNNLMKPSPMKPTTPVPKKKYVSYDDILSSMNTVVVDGKLEFINKDKLNSIIENKNQGQYKKKVTFNDKTPTPQIDKNSYIYNKFFKDYKDPHQQQQNDIMQRPLTKKELINQIIMKKIETINQRNRIAQIKSTKLMFNNNNNRNIVVNSMQNQSSLNHLFRFTPLKN